MGAFVEAAAVDSPSTKDFYLWRFVVGQLENPQWFAQCVQVLAGGENEVVRRRVFAGPAFLGALRRLLERGEAAKLLDLCAEQLAQQGTLAAIEPALLLGALLRQFEEGFVEVESPYGSALAPETIRILLRAIVGRGKVSAGQLGSLAGLALHILRQGGA